MTRRDDLTRVEDALTKIARISLGREAARLRSERSGVFLSRPSITILACLRRSGPMRLSDLARQADLEAPLISREIRGLVEEGYVRREADPTDGRAGIVRLTPAGKRASESYKAATDVIFADTFSDWQAKDLAVLAGYLERVALDFTDPSRVRRRPAAPDGKLSGAF